MAKYQLHRLPDLGRLVADIVGVAIPFNHYITGRTAFTHKAGIHTKAVLHNPKAYEILDPQDFGLARTIEIAHRLTGWNAIRDRAAHLEIQLGEAEIRDLTRRIKVLADERHLSLDDVDEVLRQAAQ
jgi:homocitrate synthase